MTHGAATYHDGRTSQAKSVRVGVDGDVLRVEGDGVIASYPLSAVRLEPRLGDLPRRLDLPDGSSCMVEADFEIAPPGAGSARAARWVNELEIRWLPALIAAAVVLGALWAAIVFGVPAAATIVARRMHPGIERQMGQQSLAALDRIALAPSTMPRERQTAFVTRFGQLARLADPDAAYTLELRASPAVGPNAFALPGGTVVLLDQLVAAAAHDDEVMAVLAHEIGHVHGRHTLRQVLQTSAAGVLVAAVVGDVLSVSSYAAALPAFLLEARYSRRFEVEADAFGLALLDRAGIDRRHFVNFLTRLEEKHGTGLPSFLSTHPRAEERGRDAGR